MADDLETPDGSTPDGDPPEPAPAIDLSSVPEAVRSTPEFKALERQNRQLARQAGAATRAAAKARSDAETARQAAEAEREAAMESAIAETLGEDGLAAWQEISDLSATDQVAAAKRFASLMQAGRAQTPPASGAPANGDGAAPPAGGQVPAQTPPPPGGGASGDVPLGTASTGEDFNATIAQLEKGYNDVVARNQDPSTRGRVTMKERSGAFMNFLGASVMKAIAENRR